MYRFRIFIYFHCSCYGGFIVNFENVVFKFSRASRSRKLSSLSDSVCSIFFSHQPSPTQPHSVANISNTESVTLAQLLTDRVYSPSPGIHVCLPFLASPEGQDVPLAAYYTYVIEWPFGRRLNDLLKRKLKASWLIFPVNF